MTIIKRAVDALKAAGHEATADELLAFATNLRDRTEELLDLYSRQAFTTKKLISMMMARCPHHEWYLVHTNVEGKPETWGPEDQIACVGCGHTVCDEQAWAFGKRVMQGDYSMYSKGGRRFGLTPQLRKRLGDKLKVKEITGEYCKERDGKAGAGPGKEPAAGSGGRIESGASDRSESEGRAVGSHS